jgi:hypothetical protein
VSHHKRSPNTEHGFANLFDNSQSRDREEAMFQQEPRKLPVSGNLYSLQCFKAREE